MEKLIWLGGHLPYPLSICKKQRPVRRFLQIDKGPVYAKGVHAGPCKNSKKWPQATFSTRSISAMPAILPPGTPAIFDGFRRAMSDAGHAVDTVSLPMGFSLHHADVSHGAQALTQAAADAAMGAKSLVLDEKPVHPLIDSPAFQPVKKGGAFFRQPFSFSDHRRQLVRLGFGTLQHLVSLFLGRRRKEYQVIVGHHHPGRALVFPAFLLAKRPQALPCIADLPAAGQDKIGLPASLKPAAAEKIYKHPGRLPSIGGTDEDPRGFRLKGPILSFFHGGDDVHPFLSQLGPQPTGTFPAVAGACKIKDHTPKTPSLAPCAEKTALKGNVIKLRKNN